MMKEGKEVEGREVEEAEQEIGEGETATITFEKVDQSFSKYQVGVLNNRFGKFHLSVDQQMLHLDIVEDQTQKAERFFIRRDNMIIYQTGDTFTDAWASEDFEVIDKAIAELKKGEKFDGVMHGRIVPCRLCGTDIEASGTMLCDGCWELETRIHREPEKARGILDELDRKNELNSKNKIQRKFAELDAILCENKAD